MQSKFNPNLKGLFFIGGRALILQKNRAKFKIRKPTCGNRNIEQIKSIKSSERYENFQRMKKKTTENCIKKASEAHFEE